MSGIPELVFKQYEIPTHMWDGIRRYIEQGIEPGKFLQAVIKNDLFAACSHADIVNKTMLHRYMQFFFMEAPPNCWGSKENYDRWVREHKARRDGVERKPMDYSNVQEHGASELGKLQAGAPSPEDGRR